MMRPPIFGQHMGQIGAAQAHAAEEVGLDDGVPVVVGQLVEGLRLVDADVVDEDVDLRVALVDFAHVIDGAQVAGEGVECRLGVGLLDPFDRLGHAVVGAAVDDDFRAFGSQHLGDGVADARGRTGDQGGFFIELVIHGHNLSTATPGGQVPGVFLSDLGPIHTNVRGRL